MITPKLVRTILGIALFGFLFLHLWGLLYALIGVAALALIFF